MVRYTLLRFLIFFGCLGLLWLLGLRSQGQEVFLVVGAAVLSLIVSYFVLRPFREQASADIAARVEHRREAAQARRAQGPRPGSDEAIEDSELGDYR